MDRGLRQNQDRQEMLALKGVQACKQIPIMLFHSNCVPEHKHGPHHHWLRASNELQ